MYLLYQVERHLRKLDQEVSKFKMELEADNAGITEMLEKRKIYISVITSLVTLLGASVICDTDHTEIDERQQ